MLRGGNSQSSTGYLFNTDYASTAGRPLTDASGRVVPVWIPGATTVGNTLPTRGAELDITTTSFYLQDRWTLARLTLDLGLRYEHVASEATGGAPSIGAQSIVPRLAASYALREDGRTVVGAILRALLRPLHLEHLRPQHAGREFGPRDERLQRTRGPGL